MNIVVRIVVFVALLGLAAALAVACDMNHHEERVQLLDEGLPNERFSYEYRSCVSHMKRQDMEALLANDDCSEVLRQDWCLWLAAAIDWRVNHRRTVDKLGDRFSWDCAVAE